MCSCGFGVGEERIGIIMAKAPGPARIAASRDSAGTLALLARGMQSDRGTYPPWTIALRTLRRARIAGLPAELRAMLASASFAHHVAAEGEGDPLFCLAHRYYLAKGLDWRQRVIAARAHYEVEDRLYRPAYFDQVYLGGGLVLWSADSPLHRYDIVLQPGRDVAYEGGLSLALRIDGACLCVLSFSLVPTRLFAPGQGLPELIHLICRRHLTRERGHQADYNRAFHRMTPAHMVFAALEGLILAQGRRHALGIAPERHPSDRAELNPHFRTGYADFWNSLGGVSLDGSGYLIELPMRLSSLQDLDPAKRKRALQRRAHLEEVRSSARSRIAGLLLPRETA
jgi:uncharacterized protein VirK/YbjX